MNEHEPWRRLLMRTEETAQAYERAQEQKKSDGACRLCEDTDSIKEYQHWRLMPNKYPYDRYFTKSDMLVLKRHDDERGLTDDEREEYFKLKSDVLIDVYDAVLDNLPKQKSIPHHCHFHMVSFKHPE